MLEIRIHGHGGDGLVTLSELIAAAAMKTGKKVQTMPHFGVERRGAPVKALVRLADEDIWVCSSSYQPDILLVFSAYELDYCLEQGIKENGRVIINATAVPACAYPIRAIDATGIAVAEGLVLGGVPFFNIPLAGALAYELGIPFTYMEEAIHKKWPGKAGIRNAQVAAVAYELMKAEDNHDRTK